MVTDYSVIADAIPADLMSACEAAIGPAKPCMKFEVVDDVKTKVAMVDSEGSPVMLPGGFNDLTAVQAAFDVLKDLEEEQSRGNHLQTYVGLARDASFAVAQEFSNFITEAITAGQLNSWVDEALNSTGLRVNSPDVANKLNQMVGVSGLTQETVDAVLATGSTTVKVFPGLKLGHVQDAVQRRIAGVV